MQTTTPTSTSAEKRWTELLNHKNVRIGKAIIELEESRKLLMSLAEQRDPTGKIQRRIESIATLVDELTH